MRAKVLENLFLELTEFRLFRDGAKHADVIGQVERDAAILAAERFHSDPHDLARGAERCEIGRAVVPDPRRQNRSLL